MMSVAAKRTPNRTDLAPPQTPDMALRGIVLALGVLERRGKAGSAGAIATAFHGTASAWNLCRERPSEESVHIALDIVTHIQWLALRGEDSALKKIRLRSHNAVLARDKSLRGGSVSKEGLVLVERVETSLRSYETDEAIVSQIATRLRFMPALLKSMHASAKLTTGKRSADLARKRRAAAVKAVHKHRPPSKKHGETDDFRGKAQRCVQHALEAFGATPAVARNAAGLRKK